MTNHLTTTDIAAMFNATPRSVTRWIQHCGLGATSTQAGNKFKKTYTVDPVTLVRWLKKNALDIKWDKAGRFRVHLGQHERAAATNRRIARAGEGRRTTPTRDEPVLSVEERLAAMENARMPEGMRWDGLRLVCRSDNIKERIE